MKHSRSKLPVVACGVAAMILAGCGSADDPEATEEPAPDEPAEEDEAQGQEPVSLRIAGTVGAGFTEVPLQAAAEALGEQGHDVEIIPLADPSLNIEGLVAGDFDITVGDTGATLNAIQAQDAPIKAIAAGLGNAWGLYSTSDIETCDDMDGRRVAIHSPESDSTAMLNNWINSECTGSIEPERLVIAGSPNRLAALLAGEVDISPLEISDGLAVTSEGEQFHQLASFAQDLPELRVTWAIASDAILAENPEAVALYLEAWAEEVRMINSDPAYLEDLLQTYAPELADQEGYREALELYIELDVYDPTLGSEVSMIEYTIDFYEQAGAIDPGLSAEQVADLSILQEEVGG